VSHEPAGRVRAEGGAAEDVDAKDALEEQGEAPLRAVVVEVESVVDPVCQPAELS